MKILIIKPSSLGDVVHALPTVDRIRHRFPDAQISWLINDTFAPLLKHCSIIDDLIEFPRAEFSAPASAMRLLAFLRRLRAHQFDLVIDLQGLFRSSVMTWVTRAPRRIGRSDAREGARFAYTEIVAVPNSQTAGAIPQRDTGAARSPQQAPANIHAVDRCLLIADYLECPPRTVSFPLGRDDAAGRAVDELLAVAPAIAEQAAHGCLVAVNPSTRWPTKLWGSERFRTLLARLPHDRVVLTGSNSEATEVAAVAGDCLNLAGKTSLTELVELLRRCAVLVTGDSGPMHLAAAVGTPVVAIFGPTDPVLTGPYGRGHVVLRADIPCSPCLKRHCTNAVFMECMERVTVEEVRAALEPFLTRQGSVR
jgi:heptosyltransferase-1